MDHRQTLSNSSAGSTAPRPSGISTPVARSQASQFQPLSVEVTVLRARNVPQFKTTLGRKREYFVTITCEATTKKTKKQAMKRTKGAQIDEQTVAWDQRLDPFLVQPSSRIILHLYAKKLTKSDIPIGMHEMILPVESPINISVALGDGNGQGEQSTPPVTLDLIITVSAHGTSPSDPQIIPTERDDTAAEDVLKPTMTPDFGGLDRSSAPGYLTHPPDRLPVESSTLMPQGRGETSLVEKPQIDLVRVDQVEEVIDRSNTWEGAVGRIKWVMDTLSPVAELHPIAQMTYKLLSVIPEELSKQYERDNNIRALVKTMHDAFDFANHEDTLKTIKPKSKEAEILTRMLRDVSICSDFIRSYIKESQFAVRMAKSMVGGVEEKIGELSIAFVENRKAFLDQAVITTKITAFQILNDMGSVSTKVDGIYTQLEWVSSQVSDATIDAKIEQIPYRTGSRFSPDKKCLPGTRRAFLDFIVDWVNNPASERCLVLFGQAGTGKSSIAHEIARRFDQMGRLTSSFVFVRKEQSKTGAPHLFTNLAHNLADRYPLFKAALGRVVKDNISLRLDTRDYGTLFQRLIREPLEDLHIVGPIFVVIDALDESGDTSGKHGLHRFLANHISELPSNFRVLITSRLEGDIEPAFLGAESVVIKHMSDDVLAATTHSDISTFLQEELDLVSFEQYGEALARRAEGLFQWAAVAAGYIQEPKSVGRKRERIKQLLKMAGDHRGQDPLNELYKGVLEAYFKNEEAVFCFLVGQLLAAFEPLSIRSLTTLLRHAPDDENAPNSVVETLSQLGSLLSNVTSSDDTLPIVPLHTSFRDFVTNKEKSGDFYVDLRVAHHQLAHSCLGLALADLKFNICNLESSYVANKDVEDLESRIVKHLPLTLSYACRFWDDHLERLDFETDLFRKLGRFFEQKFLYWLEALSLMSDVGLAPRALSSLSIWLSSGQAGS
ncbi:hypothetical protein EDB87DRAFT_647937 [Lactarius vividus]|nr:hypothetical protein EDB87DRAFT_647937 [Lactarius vividus]